MVDIGQWCDLAAKFIASSNSRVLGIKVAGFLLILMPAILFPRVRRLELLCANTTKIYRGTAMRLIEVETPPLPSGGSCRGS
jgi:hypothetical protein